MKKLSISILAILLFSISGFAQSDKEKAHNLGREAIEEMDGGNIDEAIELLEQAMKLDPERIDFPYEIAYAHYLDQDYKSAIKVLKGLTNHKQVFDRVWQLLGNSYSISGKREKAIETYEKGLELFPNSGILYLERGNMELHVQEYNKALGYYEMGIKVQPEFPSNYYWAGKIYMNSSEEVWGLIYGEIFMNLERNSRRTAEISKLIFDTYKSQITFTSDSSMKVSFCQNMTMSLDDLGGKGKELKLPFCMIYEPTMLLALVGTKDIDLKSLDMTRSNFITYYYESKHNKTHPNILFDYQKQMVKAGHFEAYNHWILMKGDEDEFNEWHKNNKDKWDGFVTWFTENPLKLSTDRRFHSSQY